MSYSEQLRDQIERSAQRLANLKARQMLTAQRDAARSREAHRRAMTQRKMALGTMLVEAGMSELEPAERLGALLAYRELVIDPTNRERYTKRGTAWLEAQKPRASTQLH